MSSSRLRVGILGSGFGGTVHAPAYAHHPAFELVAIASPNSAQTVADQLRIPQAYTSVYDMLEHAALDVLSIASPPDTHHPAAVAAFERGLHVLCEKPFCLNIKEAQELQAAATRAGKVGALAHEFRFLPARQALRELIDNGHFGELRQIEVTKVSDFLTMRSQKARGWWFERKHGGGITGAWMSHAVDMACWLAGRAPLSTIGFARTANVTRADETGPFASEVDDGAFALLDFGQGLVARITVDGTSVVDSFICGVHGEELTAIASGTSIFSERMFSIDREERSELELRELPHRALAAASPMLPAFMAMLDAFAAKIEGRPSHIATFEDGEITQRVLAAIGYGA